MTSTQQPQPSEHQPNDDRSPERPPALGDLMVTGIRRAILAGDILPGQRLVEAELAQQFGGSRATARAALIALESEGIVERLRNRGARVRIVTLREAIELLDVRMALEALCAARAAQRITEAQIVELRGIGEEMRAMVEADDHVSYSELNRLLHERVLAISEHGVAQELATKVRGRSSVTHRFRHSANPRRLEESMHEHLALIDALAGRDSAAAEAIMRRHLAAVRDTLNAQVGAPDPFTASAGSTT